MSDRTHLDHVLRCIERIERYTAEGRDAFLHDEKTQDAVLRNLHTLAESTQWLAEDLKARYPEIDWRAISGFRNVIVHNYLGLDVEQVWAVVSDDLPLLASVVARMRDDLDAAS